ncbi:MAG TPA: DinB family protein [Candidatus Eisenbacteria bacterium]|nr:DinB family protein [Candidatus Eisenbacteria bacterium]
MPVRRTIEPLEGFRSREIGIFVAQLEDQSRRLFESLDGITVEELGWQHAPGMNTIGMLLAHLAIVEIWWAGMALDLESPVTEPVIGISVDGDGMPLVEDGTPPPHFAGKDLAYYRDLLSRARAYVRETYARMMDPDLNRTITRTWDEDARIISVRWILYHTLEHFSGHYGQILLLRHMYRAAQAPTRTQG